MNHRKLVALVVGGTGLAFFFLPSGFAWGGMQMPEGVTRGLVVIGVLLMSICPALYAGFGRSRPS